jgi:hypothetical protein
MSAILKVRIPFYRRTTNGDVSGLASFYLKEQPQYLPQPSDTVLITHTNVTGSGLETKLESLSTNTVTAKFQELVSNLSQSDTFLRLMILQYDDLSFSNQQFAGNCSGYIEYDINPEQYSVLKPIESAVVVNESIPFDLNDGLITVTHEVTGTTYSGNILKGMFVKRTDTNTIFANLLKSLNLPVSDEEMKKYTRSQYGKLEVTTSNTFDLVMDGIKYLWTPIDDSITGSTNDTYVVHPTTGWVGEYYGTALQTIGSYEYTPNNKAILPIENELYLIFEIPNGSYGEIIDGKTVKFNIPYYTGTTSGSLVNAKLGFYSYNSTPIQLSAYGTYNKKNLSTRNLDRVLSEIDLSVKDIGIRPDLTNSTNYESNIVPLFSDQIKTPQGINLSEWNDGYSDLIDGTRVFNPTSQKKALYDFNNDECIGFVALDKGFIVITHPKVVDAYFRKVFNGTLTITNPTSLLSSSKSYDINGTPSDALSRGSVKTNGEHMITTLDEDENVVWDSTQFVVDPTVNPIGNPTNLGATDSSVRYISYNTEKSLNIVCLASSDEFFRTTNDTAKELTITNPNNDFANLKPEDQNLYPIIITQLGIHDSDGNLLAVCKPTQPIKKFWYDVVSFNVKIRL